MPLRPWLNVPTAFPDQAEKTIRNQTKNHDVCSIRSSAVKHKKREPTSSRFFVVSNPTTMAITGAQPMKHIPTNEAKEHLLELIDQLDDEGLVITKRGKPIARLVRYEKNHGHLIGSLKDEIKVHGDIFDVGDRWVKGRQW